MTLDLDKLAALAGAATPGPWFGPMDGVIASHPDRDPDGEWTLVVGYATRETRSDDAAYIAAASPSVVLALIERVRALEAALAREIDDFEAAARWTAARIDGGVG